MWGSCYRQKYRRHWRHRWLLHFIHNKWTYIKERCKNTGWFCKRELSAQNCFRLWRNMLTANFTSPRQCQNVLKWIGAQFTGSPREAESHESTHDNEPFVFIQNRHVGCVNPRYSWIWQIKRRERQAKAQRSFTTTSGTTWSSSPHQLQLANFRRPNTTFLQDAHASECWLSADMSALGFK